MYRRFAYLAAIAARPVVPPPLTGEVIDLLTALGDRSAVPVAPGVASADGGTVPYATILDVYVREFGWWPPRAIWPSDQDVAWGRMCNGLFWVGMVGFLVMGVLGAFNKVVLRLISDLIGGTTETEQIMRELLAGDLNAGWIETAYVVVIFGFWLLSLVAVLSKPPMLSKSQSQ